MNYIDSDVNNLIKNFLKLRIRNKSPETQHYKNPLYKKSGQSFNIKNIREFQPSDDLRNIDWKLYARTDKIFIKEFFEQENLPFYLFVDHSGSMEVIDREYFLYFVLSLCYIILRLGFTLNIIGFGEETKYLFNQLKGEKSIQKCYETIINTSFSGKNNFKNIAYPYKIRWNIKNMLVISDFFDVSEYLPIFHNTKKLLLFHYIKDIDEIFPVNNEYDIFDSELRKSRSIFINSVQKSQIKANLDELGKTLKNICINKNKLYCKYGESSPREKLYWQLLEWLYE